MIRTLILLATSWLANCMVSMSYPAWAQEYKVGVARIDITPEGPIWLTGYGSRNKPSEGVEQRLYAKALMIEDGSQTKAVLVTADVIGFPVELTEAVAGQLKEKIGIAREQFMLVASHTHTGPVIHNSLGGMFDLKGRDLTLVAIGGEVVVDYVIRLKRELGADRLWVAGYANDVFAYVPSVRILHEGGYEADYNLIYYGQPARFAPAVEDTVVKAVHDLVRQAAE